MAKNLAENSLDFDFSNCQIVEFDTRSNLGSTFGLLDAQIDDAFLNCMDLNIFDDHELSSIDTISVLSQSPAKKSNDGPEKSRCFTFLLRLEWVTQSKIYFDCLISPEEKAKTTYIFFAQSKFNQDYWVGMIYYKLNKALLHKMQEKFGQIGWEDIKCVKVESFVPYFDTTYIKNGDEYDKGIKPKTHSDRGRQTAENNRIGRQPSEGSVVTVRSDLTSTDVSKMSNTFSICPICSKKVGNTDDLCDGTVYSDGKKDSGRFINRDVYGFPDQFKSKLTDNISYLVMMAIVNLNIDGQYIFQQTNRQLFDILNCMYQRNPADSILLKAKLLSLTIYYY